MSTSTLKSTPQLGPGCERISLRNNTLLVTYEIAVCFGCVSRCWRTWFLIDAERINEAKRFRMPLHDYTYLPLADAQGQIRELLKEGHQAQGTLAEWVVVEPEQDVRV